MYTIYKITSEDVERSSTLDLDDVGKYYISLNGSLIIRDSEKKLKELIEIL